MSSDPPSLVAPWRIGVDVGGTFTDLMLRDGHGGLVVAKLPSTPDDPSRGVLDALDQVAAANRLETGALLENCALFVHGSTVATNTLLEHKGAVTGLLTTRGFRDSLEIRRGLREDMWDHRAPFAPVLVPRYLRHGIGGRIDRDGLEIEPLCRADIERAADTFRAEGVEAVAICFLNSLLNPDHERAAAHLLRDLLPDAWVSASHDVVPIMGEYERSSTVVANVYLAPRVVPYLKRLDATLRERGLTRPILLLQSNGGAVSVDQVVQRTVNLVLSGPAAGIGALQRVARQAGTDDLISMEIGGTSCDVIMMRGGLTPMVDDMLVAGYHIAAPAVEIHTVGAGGGTIARVDEGGLLKVGPDGAGALPGPACYGLGGSEPTVTDALLVLGRLRAGAYADGAVSLDAKLAEDTIVAKIAKPLGVDAEAAATGMIRLLEQNLLHAVERISIERGHDPRRCLLVAAGGAGPMFGVEVARRLGCLRVYVPRQAGAFCAEGMLNSDVRRDTASVLIGDLDGIERSIVETRFAELESEARAALDAEGFPANDQVIERGLDLRYGGQQWSIRVAAPVFSRTDIRRAFEADHQRMFGHIQPGGAILISALRVTGRGLIEMPDERPLPLADDTPAPKEYRLVHLGDGTGWRETPIYAGADLSHGHELTGPLLIEEKTTTVFVGAGDRLDVDAAGNFVIELAAGGAAHGA